MAETYCGKVCSQCDQKESLDCPGCKAGALEKHYVDCELARCCTGKKHETCDTCTASDNCVLLRGKHRMIEYRRKKQIADAQYQESIAQRAPFFGKWLWVLFWIFVAAEFAGFLTLNAFSSVKILFGMGQILGIACAVARTGVLIVMIREEEAYRKAAIFTFLGYVLEHMDAYAKDAFSEQGFGIHVTLLAAVVTFVGHYHTYLGHSNALSGLDNVLSESWGILLKCHIGLLGASVIGILLLFVIPVLGGLIAILTAIGTLALGVGNLVLLFRSAKAFQDYCEERCA